MRGRQYRTRGFYVLFQCISAPPGLRPPLTSRLPQQHHKRSIMSYAHTPHTSSTLLCTPHLHCTDISIPCTATTSPANRPAPHLLTPPDSTPPSHSPLPPHLPRPTSLREAMPTPSS